MRGFEGVEKPEPTSTAGRQKRRPKADQRSVSAWAGLKVKVFQLPQEQGKYI